MRRRLAIGSPFIAGGGLVTRGGILVGLDRAVIAVAGTVVSLYRGFLALRRCRVVCLGRIGFGLGNGALLFLDQRLPVGDRDLVVIWMNFREGQEAVPVAAVVDESRL